MGRTAAGVRSIRLREDDCVIGAVLLQEGMKVLLASENGYGKCTETDEFRLQSRGGKGSYVYKVTPKTGKLAGILAVNDKEELMLINSLGVIIRIGINAISTVGRVTQGVKLINLEEGVTVVSLAKIAEDNIVEENIAEDNITEENVVEEN